MKNKRKGFTLIELIVSIALIAIIGITIGVSLNKLSGSQNKKDEELVANKIKSAADVYLSSNSTKLNELYTNKAYIALTVGEIRKSGLLADNLIDPETGKKIEDTELVKVSFDADGTIIYTYPYKQKTEDDYIQALNVYMELNEEVDCNVGVNTHQLSYVNGTTGDYNSEYLSSIINTNKFTCNWKKEQSKKAGTYSVEYKYRLKDGSSKTLKRNFIVQEKVDVSIIANTIGTPSKVVASDTWANEGIILSAKTNRKAKIIYLWKKVGGSIDESLAAAPSLKLINSEQATYTLDYKVQNINNNEIAYSGEKTLEFKVKLENPEDLKNNDFTPTLTADSNAEWSNVAIKYTINNAKNTPISGIKNYYYSLSACNAPSWNNTPNESEKNKFTQNKKGINYVCAKYITNAGNSSYSVEAKSQIDLEGPTYQTGSVTKTDIQTTYTDDYSTNIKKYYMSVTSGTPSYTDSSWTLSENYTIPYFACGVKLYFYSYSVDEAGNKSAITLVGSVSGDACYYTGSGYVGGTTSSPSTPVTCDSACQLVQVEQDWADNCPGCTQEEYTNYLENNGGLVLGDGSIVNSYEDVNNIRGDKYEYDDVNNCTVDVTCNNGISDSGPTGGSTGGTTGGSTDNSYVGDLSGLDGLSDLDMSGLGDMDFSGLDSIGDMDFSGLSDVCLLEGTKIRLKDGYKNIEDISYEDLLTTYNYDSGKLTNVYPGWIEKRKSTTSYQKNTFSDGSELNTIGYHGVFDCDNNKFITVDNPVDFKVGTRILKFDGNEKYCVTVTNIEKVYGDFHYYHVESVGYENAIANDFLTTDGNVMIANMYGFTKDMKWPVKKVMIENNSRNKYTMDEIMHNGNYTKHLYEGILGKYTKILTPIYDINNSVTNVLKLIDLQNFLSDHNHQLDPEKNADGVSMWKVTTSDNYKTSNAKYAEGSTYTLPAPKVKANFGGWYNSGDNKIYSPGSKIKIYYATHFIAIYN